MVDELLLTDPIAPPRRYGIEHYDSPEFLGPKLRIFLDGIEQTKIVSYDCDRGVIVKLATDARGNAQLTPKGDEVAKVEMSGVVTVEWTEGRAPIFRD